MRPSLNTAMRSLMVRASSWSWVTNRKVMPTSRWISLSSTCICSRSLRSRAPRGSSRSSTLGRCAGGGGAHLLERLLGALAALCPADLLHQQAVLDVLLHAHVREQRVVLEHR